MDRVVSVGEFCTLKTAVEKGVFDIDTYMNSSTKAPLTDEYNDTKTFIADIDSGV